MKYNKYHTLIIKIGLLDRIDNSISLNIREINKRICDYYLKPSSGFKNYYESQFNQRFHISIDSLYSAIHLRVGDADNQPFKLYINRTDIDKAIKKIIRSKYETVILLSDSNNVKKKLKHKLGKVILTDYNQPCHSRNTRCINESMVDIMMMKNSNELILTRGSTFSLFGSYFSKCKHNKIFYIGHNYLHNYYFK